MLHSCCQLLSHLAWRMMSIDCYNNIQKTPVIQRCVLVVHTTILCIYVYTSSLQEQEASQRNTPSSRPLEEWMLICQHNRDLQPNTDSQDDIDWTLDAQCYPNIEEVPSFISQQRQAAGQHIYTTIQQTLPNYKASSCKSTLLFNNTMLVSIRHHCG